MYSCVDGCVGKSSVSTAFDTSGGIEPGGGGPQFECCVYKLQ